ncbi:MAG: hypothetical protein ACLTDS_02825 [Bianqueaceae bacterium]
MVFAAIKRGISCEQIHEITAIDLWFVYKLQNLARLEQRLKRANGVRRCLRPARSTVTLTP